MELSLFIFFNQKIWGATFKFRILTIFLIKVLKDKIFKKGPLISSLTPVQHFLKISASLTSTFLSSSNFSTENHHFEKIVFKVSLYKY